MTVLAISDRQYGAGAPYIKKKSLIDTPILCTFALSPGVLHACRRN
jgi:hypothetical protein